MYNRREFLSLVSSGALIAFNLEKLKAGEPDESKLVSRTNIFIIKDGCKYYINKQNLNIAKKNQLKHIKNNLIVVDIIPDKSEPRLVEEGDYVRLTTENPERDSFLKDKIKKRNSERLIYKNHKYFNKDGVEVKGPSSQIITKYSTESLS